MADAVVFSQAQPWRPALRFFRVLPGVLLRAAFTLGLVVGAEKLFGFWSPHPQNRAGQGAKLRSVVSPRIFPGLLETQNAYQLPDR